MIGIGIQQLQARLRPLSLRVCSPEKGTLSVLLLDAFFFLLLSVELPTQEEDTNSISVGRKLDICGEV